MAEKHKETTRKKKWMDLGQYVYTPAVMREKIIVVYWDVKTKTKDKGKGKG